MSLCRMNYYSWLFIYQYEIIVFIYDIKRYVFGRKVTFLLGKSHSDNITRYRSDVARRLLSVQVDEGLVFHFGPEPR